MNNKINKDNVIPNTVYVTVTTTTTPGIVYTMTTPISSTLSSGGDGTPIVTGLTATKQLENDLAAISITNKISEFWPHMPRLWFAQFEHTITPQKTSDEVKFQLAVSKLTQDALQQSSDIIYNTSLPNKYQALKERLLQVYEESINAQFKKLVSELELGTQKPSQLLRKMKDVGRTMQISEQILKNLWLTRLPAAVRASLAVTQETSLEKLTVIADNILEHINVGEIVEVSTFPHHATPTPGTCSTNFPISEMLSQMNKLTLEVATLRTEVAAQSRRRSGFRGNGRGRGRGYRYNRSKSRSNSASRISKDDPNWLCRYHYKFRDQAFRCEKPCNWNNKQEN